MQPSALVNLQSLDLYVCDAIKKLTQTWGGLLTPCTVKINLKYKSAKAVVEGPLEIDIAAQCSTQGRTVHYKPRERYSIYWLLEERIVKTLQEALQKPPVDRWKFCFDPCVDIACAYFDTYLAFQRCLPLPEAMICEIKESLEKPTAQQQALLAREEIVSFDVVDRASEPRCKVVRILSKKPSWHYSRPHAGVIAFYDQFAPCYRSVQRIVLLAEGTIKTALLNTDELVYISQIDDTSKKVAIPKKDVAQFSELYTSRTEAMERTLADFDPIVGIVLNKLTEGKFPELARRIPLPQQPTMQPLSPSSDHS